MGFRADRETRWTRSDKHCARPLVWRAEEQGVATAGQAAAQRGVRWVVVIAVVMIALPGCTVTQNIRRTLIQEPLVYSWKRDRGQSIDTYRVWADDAWAEHSASFPDLCGDDDYALGFRDGFVDFVYAGGSGDPPPVPPRHFWNVDYRSPEGHAAAAQWFAGYRHGAAAARDGGYRTRATLKSSLRYASRQPRFDAVPQPPALRPQPAPLPREIVSTPPADAQTLPNRPSEGDKPESLDEQVPSPPSVVENGANDRLPPTTERSPNGPAVEINPDTGNTDPGDFGQPTLEFDAPDINLEPFPENPVFEGGGEGTTDAFHNSTPVESVNIRRRQIISPQQIAEQQRRYAASRTHQQMPMPRGSKPSAVRNAVRQGASRILSTDASRNATRSRSRSQNLAGMRQASVPQTTAVRAPSPGRRVANQRSYQLGPSAFSQGLGGGPRRTTPRAIAQQQTTHQSYGNRSAQPGSGVTTEPSHKLTQQNRGSASRRDTLIVPGVFGTRPNAVGSAASASPRNVRPDDTEPSHTPAAPIQSNSTARKTFTQQPLKNGSWQFVR